MSVSSVTSGSTCISGSRCAIVFHSCYIWLYFVVCERHFNTIGELWANSFNANARKSKQQFWIQKVDANPCLGELLWSNNKMPNWNLAWAKIDDSKKLAAEKHRFAQRRSRQQETEERLNLPRSPCWGFVTRSCPTKVCWNEEPLPFVDTDQSKAVFQLWVNACLLFF